MSSKHNENDITKKSVADGLAVFLILGIKRMIQNQSWFLPYQPVPDWVMGVLYKMLSFYNIFVTNVVIYLLLFLFIHFSGQWCSAS